MNKKYMLGLRTCDANMTSYGGFKWPESGPVTCPDWNPEPVCGGGLHFLLWGEGDGELLDWSKDAVWMVIKAKANEVVIIDDKKAKAPSVEVVFCGKRDEATAYLANHGAQGRAISGGTATAGDRGTATAGDRGTATAGYGGTATAGDRGTATAGYGGTATAGDYGTATAGDYGTATAGDYGTATAGYRGTATAGDGGTATAGDGGTATAGYGGTATAGYGGTATAGYGGTATAGYGGTMIIKRWNGKRYKFSVAYVGEDGILPNVPYRLDGNGEFVQVESANET